MIKVRNFTKGNGDRRDKYMGDTNSKTWRRLLVLTLAVILAGSGMMIRIFVWYHDRIYNQILEEDMLQIDETSQYVANGIRSELTHSIHVLKNMYESLNLAGAVSEEEAQKFLQEANKDESFSEIGISAYLIWRNLPRTIQT